MGQENAARRRGFSVATHLAAFIAGTVLATSVASYAVPSRPKALTRDRYAALDAFAQALSYVANNYVDDIDERKLIYGAIDGLVKSLDPHSSFLPPSRYQRLREDTEGEFGGVGLTLGPGDLDDPTPVVTSVVRGSPAQRAGISIGDKVVAIDGRPTVTADDDDGAKEANPERDESRMRGPAGTRIRLEVLPRGSTSVRQIVLVRARIKVPSISSARLGGIGYVALKKFQDATTADLKERLAALRDKNGGKLPPLILDLRGNPGGLLDQGISVADVFVDSGLLVTVLSRAGSRREVERAHKPGSWTGFPMVVLVDENTASAAEIVAGALKDNARATLVGVPTYGKGTVQTFLDLKDGSGLKLTTSRYYLPSGASLEGVGIQPDLAVEGEGDTIVAGGGQASRGPPEFRDLPEKTRSRLLADRQLAAAYRHLAGRRKPVDSRAGKR